MTGTSEVTADFMLSIDCLWRVRALLDSTVRIGGVHGVDLSLLALAFRRYGGVDRVVSILIGNRNAALIVRDRRSAKRSREPGFRETRGLGVRAGSMELDSGELSDVSNKEKLVNDFHLHIW